MDEQFKPEYGRPSPREVLSILRDQHRHLCALDELADSAVELSFETTIGEWREACDWFDSDLGRILSERWALKIKRRVWRRLLQPERERTLRDLCEFLADRVVICRIRPYSIMGADCKTAGAFLTVKRMLRDHGADVCNLAPSTPLGEYARKYWHLFVEQVSQLAPGVLPAVEVQWPTSRTGYAFFQFGWLPFLVGCLLMSSASAMETLPIALSALLLQLLGAFVIVACYVFGLIFAKDACPTGVRFGRVYP